MNVGDDTTTGDGGLDEGVKLFVTTDGELHTSTCKGVFGRKQRERHSHLKVAGSDALDLQVLGGVACGAGVRPQKHGFALEVLPASSRTSAVRYSRMAAV